MTTQDTDPLSWCDMFPKTSLNFPRTPANPSATDTQATSSPQLPDVQQRQHASGGHAAARSRESSVSRQLQQLVVAETPALALQKMTIQRNVLSARLTQSWQTLTGEVIATLQCQLGQLPVEQGLTMHREHALSMQTLIDDAYAAYQASMAELGASSQTLQAACARQVTSLPADAAAKAALLASMADITQRHEQEQQWAGEVILNFASGVLETIRMIESIPAYLDVQKQLQDLRDDPDGEEALAGRTQALRDVLADEFQKLDMAQQNLGKVFSFIDGHRKRCRKDLFSQEFQLIAFHGGRRPIRFGRDLVVTSAELLLDVAQARSSFRMIDFQVQAVQEGEIIDEFLNNVREAELTSLATHLDDAGGAREKVLELLALNQSGMISGQALRSTFSEGLAMFNECRMTFKNLNTDNTLERFDSVSTHFSDQLLADASAMMEFCANQLELAMLGLHDGQPGMHDTQRLHARFVNDLRRASKVFHECCPNTRISKMAEHIHDKSPLHVALIQHLKNRFEDFSSQLSCIRDVVWQTCQDKDDLMQAFYFDGLEKLEQVLDDSRESIFLVLQASKQMKLDKDIKQQAIAHFNTCYESPAEKKLSARKREMELDLLIEAEQLAAASQQASTVTAAAPKKSAKSRKASSGSKSTAGKSAPAASQNHDAAKTLRANILQMENSLPEQIRWFSMQCDEALHLVKTFPQLSPLNIEQDLEWAASYLHTALQKAEHGKALYDKLAALANTPLSAAEQQNQQHYQEQINGLHRRQTELLALKSKPVLRAREAFAKAPSLELFFYLHEKGQFARSPYQGRGFSQSAVSYWGKPREFPDWVEERDLRLVPWAGNQAGQGRSLAYPHFHYDKNGELSSIFLKLTDDAQRYRAYSDGQATYHGLVDSGRGGKLGEDGKKFVQMINQHLLPQHAVPLKVKRPTLSS
ncbi:MAG: hypothetical protein ACRYGK_02920 [Janthinobacterium lividum]